MFENRDAGCGPRFYLRRSPGAKTQSRLNFVSRPEGLRLHPEYVAVAAPARVVP
jgi:hypothetical protein